MKPRRHVAVLIAAVAILAISGAAIAKTDLVFDEAAGVWKDPNSGAWYDETKGAWMPAETAPTAVRAETSSTIAQQISELTNVDSIRYTKTTSGEGGRSGTLIRKFISDPGAEIWFYENQSPDDGFFMRRDSNGNTIETRSPEGDVRNYPGSRGNGVSPTTEELEAGPGARWQTVVRTGADTTRDCTLGDLDEISIGTVQVTAVRWRCSSQRHDKNLPFVSEFAGIRINGILRAVEEKRCWTHDRAAYTCRHSPSSYDGYAHYVATAIER